MALRDPATPTLVLASTSPRRAALLREAGIAFRLGPATEVDETPPPGLAPGEVARRLAERKARAAAALLPGELILAADTVVALGSVLLGKPGGRAEAAAMLRGLSGRVHEVLTGVAVARGKRCVSDVARARVGLRALDPDEIERYAAGGEGWDKAGGYAIQGGGGAFVASLEGERDTVVGLPVALARRLLGRF